MLKRLVFLCFDANFEYGEEEDKQLKYKLEAPEVLSAFLNYALDAWVDLYYNNFDMTVPESGRELKDIVEDSSDTVLGWLKYIGAIYKDEDGRTVRDGEMFTKRGQWPIFGELNDGYGRCTRITVKEGPFSEWDLDNLILGRIDNLIDTDVRRYKAAPYAYIDEETGYVHESTAYAYERYKDYCKEQNQYPVKSTGTGSFTSLVMQHLNIGKKQKKVKFAGDMEDKFYSSEDVRMKPKKDARYYYFW